MAALETFRSPAAAPMRGAFHRFVVHASTALKDWNDARVTRKALSQLSARELDDIGLIPGDIDALSRKIGK